MSALCQKRTFAGRPFNLQRPSRESIAIRNFARIETVQEPTLALRRSAVGEGIRDYIALRFSLQPIVPDGGGGLQRLIDVARVKEAVLLLGVIRPYAGKAIGL